MLFFGDPLPGSIHSGGHLPRRIVSLVPSLTELLYDLGLEEEVAGITKFCIHPDHWFRHKPRIGGTKNINFDSIHALSPDFIITSKEENVKEQVEELARHYPVWVTNIANLRDALQMIVTTGKLTGRTEKAATLAERIQTAFASLETPSRQDPSTQNLFRENASFLDPSRAPAPRPRRAAYFIWKDPWMAAGGGTFIDDMLQHCGLTNVFAGHPRYPVVDWPALNRLECEWILLSSEPYPFAEKHMEEIRRQVPHASVRLVDGELFSWYGSRLLHTPAYFRRLRDSFFQNTL